MADRPSSREGVSVIELDLSGRKALVSSADLEWLRAQAEKEAGRSSSAGELAGRLAGLRAGQRRLVFVRTEVRALLNVFDAAAERVPPGLTKLNELVHELLASS